VSFQPPLSFESAIKQPGELPRFARFSARSLRVTPMKSSSSRWASWLYYGTGGSVLLCAVRHGTFNLFTATAAAKKRWRPS
jgi:hypothetical protein